MLLNGALPSAAVVEVLVTERARVGSIGLETPRVL